MDEAEDWSRHAERKAELRSLALADEARRWLGKLAPEFKAARPDPRDGRRWRRWADACRVELLTLDAPVRVADLAWGLLIAARLADPAVVEEVRAQADRYAARTLRWAAQRKAHKEGVHETVRAIRAYRGREAGKGWREMLVDVEERKGREIEAMIRSGVEPARAVEIATTRERAAAVMLTGGL